MDVSAMEEIAQPLDEWCELCSMKIAVGVSADGVAACMECMTKELTAIAARRPNREQRRRMRRAVKRGGRGYTR